MFESDDLPLVDPNEIDGDYHILHPKPVLPRLGEKEKHPFIDAQARPAAEPFVPRRLIFRDICRYVLIVDLYFRLLLNLAHLLYVRNGHHGNADRDAKEDDECF